MMSIDLLDLLVLERGELLDTLDALNALLGPLVLRDRAEALLVEVFRGGVPLMLVLQIKSQLTLRTLHSTRSHPRSRATSPR